MTIKEQLLNNVEMIRLVNADPTDEVDALKVKKVAGIVCLFDTGEEYYNNPRRKVEEDNG